MRQAVAGTTIDWPLPRADDPSAHEYAFGFRRAGRECLLIVPALFEEANRTRRMLVDTMRALHAYGPDVILADLPGCNESLADFSAQTLESWRGAMADGASRFGATHVLAVRGGALVAPTNLPGWALEPVKGAGLLRQLLRARVIGSRDAGREEKFEDLLAQGRSEGLELAGYRFGAKLIAGLETAHPAAHLAPITLAEIGGAALWLRSEPGEDTDQSAALARKLAAAICG
ncbi:MAG: hypothetical protein NVS3B27_17510 [Novosphingobium sp.]